MRRRVFISVWVAALAVSTLVGPASATHPGARGVLTFSAGYSGSYIGRSYQVNTINPDGTGRHRITNLDEPVYQSAWSPDGNKLALWTIVDPPDGNVWVMNADGTGLRQIALASDMASFLSWSRNGDKIAYVSRKNDPFGLGQVWTMNPDGSNKVQLTSNGNGKAGALFSPVADVIYYVQGYNLGAADPDEQVSAVWKMNSDGTNPELVFSFGVGETGFTVIPTLTDIAPDGSALLFQTIPCYTSQAPSNCNETANQSPTPPQWNLQAHKLDLATGTFTTLTNNPEGMGSPHYSPDGTLIAGYGSSDAEVMIFTMPASGGPVTKIYSSPKVTVCPGGTDCNEIVENIVDVGWQPCVATTLDCTSESISDMAVSVTSDSFDVQSGDPATFDVLVTNEGPDPAPSTMTFSFTGGSYEIATGGCSASGNTVTCPVPPLPEGESTLFQVTVRASAGSSSISSTATIDSSVTDPNPANDQDRLALGSGAGGADYPRALSLQLRRHLVARGLMTTVDGPGACISGALVRVQRRTATGDWVTVGRDRTDSAGEFRTSAPDRAGRYRALTTKLELPSGDVCLGARSPRRAHEH